MAERKAVTKQMARRYAKASKTEKGLMLDELCALTEWTRRHARRALRQALSGTPEAPRKPRGRIYGQDVIQALRVVWATMNGPAGKRLAPFMAEIVEALERHGELPMEPGVRTKLLAMSSATIDRALAPERRRLRVGYGRYDTPEELEALRELYRVLRLYVNFFQPQMKLVAKTRRGAKVTKRFDRARTPYQRVLDSPDVDEEAKDRLRATYLRLNPAQLKRDLAARQTRLLQLGKVKPSTGKEVKHPPGPPLKGPLSKAHASRTSLVMQPVAASRTS